MINDPMKTMLSIKKELEISPHGISMKPFLKEGRDKVKIQEHKTLKKYDIVLYKVCDEYVLHRIIGFNKTHYIICGDNARLIEKIEKDRIIGVVTDIIRNKKIINTNSFLNKLYWFLWYCIGLKKVVLFVRRIKIKLGKILKKQILPKGK